MQKMAQSAISPVANLVLRVFTLVLLLIALIILVTNSTTVQLAESEIHFQHFHSYIYMLCTIVFGIAYTLLQLAFSIQKLMIISGEDKFHLFDFYGDKIISYSLVSGAAAGFAVTVDFQNNFDWLNIYGHFVEKSYASASVLLLAFLCNAILSVLSSFALPKRD